MDIGTILCATDGSAAAGKALALACELAKCKSAKLLVLHVHHRRHHGPEPDELEVFAMAEHMAVSEAGAPYAVSEMIAKEAESVARAAGLRDVESLVVEGDPTRRITDIARDRRADAIVVGSRGLGEVAGLLLGSVSHKLAQLAPCTCIIVR
jgi:nucleotide-binding universal stress UspA family protein